MSSPAFRRVWLGFTASAAGDAASWVALVALCVGPAGGSLPLLAVLYTAPVVIGGVGAGWLLDRFDRRLVIVVDSLVRGAAFASIPIAIAVGSLSALHLYLVAAGYGLLKMVSLAGFPAMIPSLVPDSGLEQANALEGISFGLASLCGAALAGVGVATVGAVPVVACDAASYGALAVALLSVRGLRSTGRRRRASARGPGSGGGAGVGQILRLAATHPILRTTTIMFAVFNIGEGCLLVFLPHRAVGIGLGSGGYGYLVAATTAGELAAGVVLAHRRWRFPLRASIVGAQLAASVAVLVMTARSAAATVVALVALGLLSAPMTAWAQTLRMRVVPAGQHGRLFAVLRTAMQATPPLGAGLGALLVAHGPTATVLAVAAIMGLPVLVLAPNLLRAAEPDARQAPSTPGEPAERVVS